MGERVFWGCVSIKIYCEAVSKPDGWTDNWNPDNRTVYWNFVYIEVTYSFETNGDTGISPITAIFIDEQCTQKDGYHFEGWYDNVELLGEKIEFPYHSNQNITLYAKW